ncbi:hypothetical protein [Nonomuraea sp. NPDC005501]|uniref:WD40 repeat domain-containing protein n=1 Tax=Nonomuraea sp. NPDC005501 TaxID=3156884 RepID=UPI0033B8B06B
MESGALCWTIEDRLADVALSPNGTRLAGARIQGPVIVHDAATGQPLEPRFVVPGEPSLYYRTVAFSADGQLLAVGDHPGRVTVFQFNGLKFTRTHRRNRGRVGGCPIPENGRSAGQAPCYDS